jgi:hypothetical protein
MPERVLTETAQFDRDEFELHYNNCSCHIHPPCISCTHPGNPLNHEDDQFWEDVFVEEEYLDNL